MVRARNSRSSKVPAGWVVMPAGLTLCVAVAFAQDRAPAENPHAAALAPAEWVDDLTPITASHWNYDRAAHLLERAGFSGPPEEIERLAAMTPEQAVDYLVDYESIEPETTPFDPSQAWGEEMYADVDRHLTFFGAIDRAYEVGEAYGKKPAESGERRYQDIAITAAFKILSSAREWQRVALWWANRMLTTTRPLEEKMTLFWHGHFANEEQKIRDYRLMFYQNQTFRRRATGNFRDMLVAISQDPAMLVYLDNRKNVKGHANENYAREILELFALGVGNYTEDDIKEVGRAFTGWRNEGLRFINDPTLHDEDNKTIFGKTGNFDGYDAIDLILEQKVCAEWVAGKFHRFFVREEISPALKAELASTFRDSNYEIKPLLKAIFLSRDFYSQASVGTQIKGPVHYYVSAGRRLGLDQLPGTPRFAPSMTGLGQVLGNPPNVKGWDGGRAWINPSTLVQRANLMRQLLDTRDDDAPSPAHSDDASDRFGGRSMMTESEERESNRFKSLIPKDEDSETSQPDGDSEMKGAPSMKQLTERGDYAIARAYATAYELSYSRIKPIPATPAELNITEMAKSAGVETAEDAVDYFIHRFLRVELGESDRQLTISYMKHLLGGEKIDYESPEAEDNLREVLHSIMSTVEFQLG